MSCVETEQFTFATQEDLEAARRVAVEAVIMAVDDIEAGGDDRSEFERVAVVGERAWALQALGSPADDPARRLSDRDLARLLKAVEAVEWYQCFIEDPDGNTLAEVTRRFGPILADAARVRAILEAVTS